MGALLLTHLLQKSAPKRCAVLRELTKQVIGGVSDSEAKILLAALTSALRTYDDRKSILVLQVSSVRRWN